MNLPHTRNADMELKDLEENKFTKERAREFRFQMNTNRVSFCREI